jgi:hypothetical protein
MTDTTIPADAIKAWETYREEQSNIPGMFGLTPRPSFLAGWQARSASQPAQEPVQLQRFGVKWKGQTEPFMEQMPDGYWTPWHIADAALRAAPPADTARQDRILSLIYGLRVAALVDDWDTFDADIAALEAEVRKG